ncbi:bifunctional nuclease family protein [uncultured Arsenicicoccus sp.]|uniref:bifunctional nuclease family protein n=1 Tax=uncultured Arsenicicoccus sp. TaxID=491339 RepID=UPI00259644BD|nr:bifunctional nuclease family protein [uncultured Arsenicicoccus sp.]
MRSLEVLGVRVEMPTNKPIVLLKETDGTRFLPIWVGAAEATAIAYAQQGVEPPRPLTHDLIATLIPALGHRLTEIRISSLQDSYFRATLVFDGTVEVDSRASDAIAIALRTGTGIVTTEAILDEAGVTISGEGTQGEGGEVTAEDEVERFREFLDHVTPEDFEGGPGEGPHEA